MVLVEAAGRRVDPAEAERLFDCFRVRHARLSSVRFGVYEPGFFLPSVVALRQALHCARVDARTSELRVASRGIPVSSSALISWRKAVMNKGFRDECGVFGVCDSEDAANLAYLGLYALQHRGQESAGIASLDEKAGLDRARDGLRRRCLRRGAPFAAPGRTAIGHVRYSTAGASLLDNAQPIVFATGRGPLALAHNGNLVNAREIRARLESKGAMFTTTSDSEVILHLVARSQAPTLAGAIAEALSEVRGAYSLVILSREGIFAARDPNGIRPALAGQSGKARPSSPRKRAPST